MQPTPMTLPLRQEKGLLLALGMTTGVEFYVADGLNLILVDIAGAMGISLDQASWILTVYTGAMFIGIPLSGWMAAHFGPRRYLIGSLCLFGISTIGCMISMDFPVFLFWRFIQGIAGSALFTWWRGTIYTVLPKAKRGASMQKTSMRLSLSSACGLLVSGWVTEFLGWRLMFLPALVLAGAAVALLLRHYPDLPPSREERHQRPDWFGAAIAVVSIGALQVVLSRGDVDDWFASGLIRGLSAITAIGVVLFVAWQLSPRNDAPLLHLGVLRDRMSLSAGLLGVPTGMILAGCLFELPEFLRGVMQPDFSASQAGVFLAIYSLMTAFARSQSGKVHARIGQRNGLLLAMMLLVLSMLLINRLMTSGTPPLDYMPALALFAACQTLLLPGIGSGAMSRVSDERFLDAVTIYMTARQFGASLGISLLTVLIDHRLTLHSSRLYEALQTGRESTAAWLRQGGGLLLGHSGLSPERAVEGAIDLLSETGRRQVETLAYADGFLFMAAVGTLTVFLIPLMPPTPVKK
ncbi:major facilitator superfamily MFS_1 [Tanticharoenia sakaeratensis NBRC 103193]|uniref:Major facilitator superfamily MFS_1 n=2 Tax=Tanticharoenia TaxID=444052 RepID=A0A0D6MQZ1_9PROT|nr:major facilitator superfamily MFS_1 [Tanticharoenia sakaeratensis NBRC 103193]GBQ25587.1 major facilitator superfamily transporter [Tanticharoenia sakaeratensis NBRC 103193]